jgi:hypothetical protein
MHQVVCHALSKLLPPIDDIFDLRSGYTALTESGPPVALEMTVPESHLFLWSALIYRRFLGLQFVAKTRKIRRDIERTSLSTVRMWEVCCVFHEFEYGHTVMEFILPV